ncbi:MAG: TIGR04282 family arsenosugar biosynthesis glycosyltransferase [Actinomycetota bacterium]
MNLLVIAKQPLPGLVKTRLCPPCTSHEAARIARGSLADTLRAVAATPARRRVLVLDGEPGSWKPPGFEVVSQRGEGLDERLAAAFAHVGGPSLLVGMDTPQLTPSLLTLALDRLAAPGVDAVLGGARDGGWWGIGLHRPDDVVFLGVPMSTDRTGEAQRTRLDELGLRSEMLPQLRDVDRFDDALAVAADVPGSLFARAVDRVEARRAAQVAAGSSTEAVA